MRSMIHITSRWLYTVEIDDLFGSLHYPQHEAGLPVCPRFPKRSLSFQAGVKQGYWIHDGAGLLRILPDECACARNEREAARSKKVVVVEPTLFGAQRKRLRRLRSGRRRRYCHLERSGWIFRFVGLFELEGG